MSGDKRKKTSCFFTGLLSLFLLSGCYYSIYEKPVFMLGPAKQQIMYPHGEITQVLFSGDFMLITNCKGNGYDVQAFDISDPEKPLSAGGIPSLGGVFEQAALNPAKKYAYIPTPRSIMVVCLPVKSGDKIELKENITSDDVSFRQAKLSGWSLYVSSSAGIIVYDISIPHRPMIRQVIPHTEKVRIICPAGNVLYWVDPDNPHQLRSTGNVTQNYPAEITALYEVGGKLYLLLKNGQLINRQGNAIAEKVENLFAQDNTFYYEVQGEAGAGSPPPRYLCSWKGGAVTQYAIPLEMKPQRGAGVNETMAIYGIVQDSNLYLIRMERKDRMNGQLSRIKQIPIFQNNGTVGMKKGYISWSSRQGNRYEVGYSRYDKSHGSALSDYRNTYTLLEDKLESSQLPEGFHGAEYGVKPYVFSPTRLFRVAKPGELTLLAKTGPAAVSIKQDENLIFLAQIRTGSIYRLPNEEESKAGEIPRQVGVIPVPDADHPAYDVEPDANMLYICGKRFLTVMNQVDPANIRKVSEMSLPSDVRVMLRFGNHLYIPSADKRNRSLYIINISNPGKPFIEKEIPEFTDEVITQMVRHGETFLIGDGSAIRQIDVSVPLEPKEIRRFEGPSHRYEPYRYLSVDNGDLVGKKVHRVDIWRKFELMKAGN